MFIENMEKYGKTNDSMARLPWLIRTRFLFASKFFHQLKKTNIQGYFRDIFLFYYENLCCVYSLESPHWGDSDEYIKHTIIL